MRAKSEPHRQSRIGCNSKALPASRRHPARCHRIADTERGGLQRKVAQIGRLLVRSTVVHSSRCRHQRTAQPQALDLPHASERVQPHADNFRVPTHADSLRAPERLHRPARAPSRADTCELLSVTPWWVAWPEWTEIETAQTIRTAHVILYTLRTPPRFSFRSTGDKKEVEFTCKMLIADKKADGVLLPEASLSTCRCLSSWPLP